MMKYKGRIVLMGAALASLVAGAALITSFWDLPMWQGLYCSIGLATTEGCNYSPTSRPAQIVAVGLMIVTIPLLAATFGLLQNIHLHKKINKSIDRKLAAHHEAIKELIENGGNGSSESVPVQDVH